MTARTFGRKGQGHDEEMARRREAFIAEERARAARLQTEPVGAGAPGIGTRGSHSASPVIVREKSLGAAYLFWFFFGAVGAHRFYLGFPVSGVILAGAWMTCWMMLLAGFVLAAPVMVFMALWILGDAFFIPGLHRKANERARQNAVPYVFA
jgi:TM2 domain-containing membrane protein YozV